jgi:hypothetical protein
MTSTYQPPTYEPMTDDEREELDAYIRELDARRDPGYAPYSIDTDEA